jgi:chromosome segregation ATPase
LKTSILEKVTAKRFQEKEEAIKKMSGESKKLKWEFNLAQLANIDLEKKVADLADALKRCQDDLESSQKEVERLKKTREDDLKLIENLRQDADKSSKNIDELRSAKTVLSTRNSDVAKTLSNKEQKIQDLEKALFERSEASGQEIVKIMDKLKLLFEEYRKALRDFGVHPAPFLSVKRSPISWTGLILNSRHFLGLYQVQATLPLLSQWKEF